MYCIYTVSHYRSYINICMVNERKNINKLQSTQSRKANNYIQIKFIYTGLPYTQQIIYVCVCEYLYICEITRFLKEGGDRA